MSPELEAFLKEAVEALDRQGRYRVSERRRICGCATWPKPCTECDAYEDAWYEASDFLERAE